MTVYVGANTTEDSAELQIDSTTNGMLVPRMTTTQRDAISSPAESLMIFNTTTNQFEWYDLDNTQWESIASGSSGALDAPTELTISSGAITKTGNYHSIDTESDAVSDDLDTISGGSAQDELILYAVNDARTVVIKNGTGNIFTYSGNDISLDEDHKRIHLVSDGTNWYEVGNADDQSASITVASEIQLTASGASLPTTNGAERGTIETTTNAVLVPVLNFDAATDEYAQWAFNLPSDYDGGTVTAEFVWSAGSGTGDVVWGLQAVSFANDDALDTAFGTAQTITDTLIATEDVHVTSATSAITIADTPSAGDLVVFRAYRDADNGNDTFSADAQLINIVVTYTRS